MKVVKDHYPDVPQHALLNQLIAPIILDRYVLDLVLGLISDMSFVASLAPKCIFNFVCLIGLISNSLRSKRNQKGTKNRLFIHGTCDISMHWRISRYSLWPRCLLPDCEGLRFDAIENARILPPILAAKAKQLAKTKALEKWISNVPVRFRHRCLDGFVLLGSKRPLTRKCRRLRSKS